MSASSEPAVETAWRVAETQGVDDDLDAIREIDTDADGVTVRVLLEDAESETDQVGFDSTRPRGQMADQMFRDSLRNGMRDLKRYLRNDGLEDDTTQADDETVADTDDTDDSGTDNSVTDDSGTDDSDTHNKTEMRAESAGDPAGGNETVASEPHGREADELRVKTVALKTELAEDSLDSLRADLDETLEEAQNECVGKPRIEDVEARLKEIDKRLTAIEEQLSMLGSPD